MKLTLIPLAKSLNKAYLKQSLKREQIDHFVYALYNLREEEIAVMEGKK